MEFICNPENLKDELKLLLHLFDTKKIEKCSLDLAYDNGVNTCTIVLFTKRKKEYQYFKVSTDELTRKEMLRFTKNSLYETLSNFLHQHLTWGSLTGIRPQKIYKEILDDIKDNLPINQKLDLAKERLCTQYFVTKKKAEILNQIYLTQGEYEADDKKVHLYINIPFCPTRCSYCSFVACGIDKFSYLVEPYLEQLIKEINATLNYLNNNGYEICTIYIGGGTPTSLNKSQLERLLDTLRDVKVNEFTIEAGRPDTINSEKLDLFKRYHVTRISINPQSFKDKTLVDIGRKHTSSDIITTFNLAKPYGFNVNMDLIAGLDNETLTDFKYSLKKCISLNPTDITVHTLSIKNTSNLKLNGGNISKENSVGKMVNYAYKTLIKNGYNPYYLYRQKNMLGNHENIGYTKNYSCVFNVISMDELATVVACGANAISKKLTLETNRIERFANVKNITDYNNRIDEIIHNKLAFFDEK